MSTRKIDAAFSLIEVTIAIGIVSFAFVSLLGLIPLGLNNFHCAMNSSVGSQIGQAVLNDAQQTDFSTLTGGKTTPFLMTTGSNTILYFDDQGGALPSAAGAIYQAIALVTPATMVPNTGNTSLTTLATVTVQVATNPGNQPIATGTTGLLWCDPRFSIYTFTGFVAQNQ